MSVAAASYFPVSLAELNLQNQLFLGMVSLPLLFCLCFLCCLPYRCFENSNTKVFLNIWFAQQGRLSVTALHLQQGQD